MEHVDTDDLSTSPKQMAEDTKYPKVLVACPTVETKEYALTRYVQVIEELTYPNYDVLLVDNSNDPEHAYMELVNSKGLACQHVTRGRHSREAIVKSQNRIRDVMLEGDYEFLMFIEQDIFPPKDVIEKLMAHNEHSANALYYHGYFDERRHPFIMDEINGQSVLDKRAYDLVRDKKLHKVQDPGFGCSLISRKMLEDIPFRWEENDHKHGDRYFYIDARDKGYDVYLDTSILCEHWNRPWIPFVVSDR